MNKKLDNRPMKCYCKDNIAEETRPGKPDTMMPSAMFPMEREMLFNKRIWRIDDVAKFLGCSVGHIYNLSSDEKIPKIKKGKFLFFIPSEVLEWVLQGDFNND